MSKYLFLAVGVAAVLASGAVSAQGLPFSSTHSTNQRWSVNRGEPRNMNIFHAGVDQQQPDESAATPERITRTN